MNLQSALSTIRRVPSAMDIFRTDPAQSQHLVDRMQNDPKTLHALQAITSSKEFAQHAQTLRDAWDKLYTNTKCANTLGDKVCVFSPQNEPVRMMLVGEAIRRVLIGHPVEVTASAFEPLADLIIQGVESYRDRK